MLHGHLDDNFERLEATARWQRLWKVLIVVLASLASLKSFPQELREEWAARYNGPVQGHAHAKAISVDRSGEVVVAGDLDTLDSNSAYGVFKYRPDGSLLWSERYRESGGGKGRLVALALDLTGNIYLTGDITNPSAVDSLSTDIITVKLDPGGSLQWATRFGGPDGFDTVSALAVDLAGNAIIAGSTNGSQYITVKYDPNGRML